MERDTQRRIGRYLQNRRRVSIKDSAEKAQSKEEIPMGKILTLSGGKEIEVYTNTHCPLCGKETYQTVCCHFHEANVCYKHCGECRNFRKEFQQCVYKPLSKEIRRFCKEKTTGK